MLSSTGHPGFNQLPATRSTRARRTGTPLRYTLLVTVSEPRVGLLLLNLGTPASAGTPDVRRYLQQFLSDPRVIDASLPARAIAVAAATLFRAPKSAAAYAKIWTASGSPLLVHGRGLRSAVAERLGERAVVDLAMRYGEPSVPGALQRLVAAEVERIIVLPLFPQYASSSSGSALEAVLRSAAKLWNVPRLETLAEFYDDAGFIASLAEVARPRLAAIGGGHLLLSYHGLPERQVRKSDPSGGHCLRSAGCCDQVGVANRHCYRAQCAATSRALASALDLGESSWSMSFQSRLGRTPWIQPDTTDVLPELAARGVKRLAVMCPSFVADCLETLEEIGIRGREQWQRLGGESLELIPCLNAHPRWVDTIVSWVRLSDSGDSA